MRFGDDDACPVPAPTPVPASEADPGASAGIDTKDGDTTPAVEPCPNEPGNSYPLKKTEVGELVNCGPTTVLIAGEGDVRSIRPRKNTELGD